MLAKVLTVVGARPQFVKAAAVSRALRRTGTIEECIVHTGQHFDDNMSAVFFDELDVPTPRHAFDIHGGSHGDMTGRMLAALERVMLAEQPRLVLVYGDTNSTLAGGLAAAKLQIPVAHVEAGLRSFNRGMPEEINRVLVDHLSTLLFAPTLAAVKNLAAEGLSRGVVHTGDVMLDACLHARARAMEHSVILDRLDLVDSGYALATVHRVATTDNPHCLDRVMRFLDKVAEETIVVMPVHPRTRTALSKLAFQPARMRLIDPVGYIDMNRLLAGASTVFTDLGGLQKEAYFHRVPCVTLREETEWVETVAAGWNRLWTTETYAQPRHDIAEYGDGRASDAAAGEIARFLGA